jgi:hypothetical protein
MEILNPVPPHHCRFQQQYSLLPSRVGTYLSADVWSPEVNSLEQGRSQLRKFDVTEISAGSREAKFMHKQNLRLGKLKTYVWQRPHLAIACMAAALVSRTLDSFVLASELGERGGTTAASLCCATDKIDRASTALCVNRNWSTRCSVISDRNIVRWSHDS